MNMDKHSRMQATVEDFEDVDPADDLPLKENESPSQGASMRDDPAGEVPSSRPEVTAGGIDRTTLQPRPRPNSLPAPGHSLDETVSRSANSRPINSFFSNARSAIRQNPLQVSSRSVVVTQLYIAEKNAERRTTRNIKTSVGLWAIAVRK